jgi:hypothetical protein
MFYSLFLEHPKSLGMTYFEHFKRAISMCIQSGAASFALFVHAFVPKYFPDTGSTIIKKLNKDIESFHKDDDL